MGGKKFVGFSAFDEEVVVVEEENVPARRSVATVSGIELEIAVETALFEQAPELARLCKLTSKRDSLSRRKGLRGAREALSTTPAAALTALGRWVALHFGKRLSRDPDPAVCAEAIELVAALCALKSIGVREVVPPWWLAQSDPEVAKLARATWRRQFGENNIPLKRNAAAIVALARLALAEKDGDGDDEEEGRVSRRLRAGLGGLTRLVEALGEEAVVQPALCDLAVTWRVLWRPNMVKKKKQNDSGRLLARAAERKACWRLLEISAKLVKPSLQAAKAERQTSARGTTRTLDGVLLGALAVEDTNNVVAWKALAAYGTLEGRFEDASKIQTALLRDASSGEDVKLAKAVAEAARELSLRAVGLDRALETLVEPLRAAAMKATHAAGCALLAAAFEIAAAEDLTPLARSLLLDFLRLPSAQHPESLAESITRVAAVLARFQSDSTDWRELLQQKPAAARLGALVAQLLEEHEGGEELARGLAGEAVALMERGEEDAVSFLRRLCDRGSRRGAELSPLQPAQLGRWIKEQAMTEDLAALALAHATTEEWWEHIVLSCSNNLGYLLSRLPTSQDLLASPRTLDALGAAFMTADVELARTLLAPQRPAALAPLKAILEVCASTSSISALLLERSVTCEPPVAELANAALLHFILAKGAERGCWELNYRAALLRCGPSLEKTLRQAATQLFSSSDDSHSWAMGVAYCLEARCSSNVSVGSETLGNAAFWRGADAETLLLLKARALAVFGAGGAKALLGCASLGPGDQEVHRKQGALLVELSLAAFHIDEDWMLPRDADLDIELALSCSLDDTIISASALAMVSEEAICSAALEYAVTRGGALQVALKILDDLHGGPWSVDRGAGFMPDDSRLREGAAVGYFGDANSAAVIKATVLTVHEEAEDERFYTVRLEDGREKQTVRSRLTHGDGGEQRKPPRAVLARLLDERLALDDAAVLWVLLRHADEPRLSAMHKICATRALANDITALRVLGSCYSCFSRLPPAAHESAATVASNLRKQSPPAGVLARWLSCALEAGLVRPTSLNDFGELALKTTLTNEATLLALRCCAALLEGTAMGDLKRRLAHSALSKALECLSAKEQAAGVAREAARVVEAALDCLDGAAVAALIEPARPRLVLLLNDDEQELAHCSLTLLCAHARHAPIKVVVDDSEEDEMDAEKKAKAEALALDAVLRGDSALVNRGSLLAWLVILEHVASHESGGAQATRALSRLDHDGLGLLDANLQAAVARCADLRRTFQVADDDNDARAFGRFWRSNGADSAALGVWVVYRTLKLAPSNSREWSARCRPRDAEVARRVAEDSLQCAVVRAELSVVAVEALRVKPMDHPESTLDLKVSRASRELQAVYRRDECAIEMTLRYAPSHPLRAVAVDFGQHQGVDDKTARRWALQLRGAAHQRSALAAVAQWRANVDLEFDGVEPCPICYGILHPKSKRLPHLQCAQCNNKFHASCLSEWFAKSHKHLCVVCQTEFVVAKSSKGATERGASTPAPPPATAVDDELD